MATLYIRDLTDDDLERFNRAARVRGCTQREYLLRLIDLHEACRAQHRLDGVGTLLADLGLDTVTA